MAEVPPVARSPWSSSRSRAFDVAFTAVLLLGVVVMLVGPATSTAMLLSVAEILPLALRRVRPTLSFALVAGAMAVQVLVNDVPVWGQVAMPVAVYSECPSARCTRGSG